MSSKINLQTCEYACKSSIFQDNQLIYLKTITDTATEYVEGIFQRLREHEYNPELMRLYVLGGGSCLIRNFGTFDKERVTINDDICATAKGYEYLAELNMRRDSS